MKFMLESAFGFRNGHKSHALRLCQWVDQYFEIKRSAEEESIHASIDSYSDFIEQFLKTILSRSYVAFIYFHLLFKSKFFSQNKGIIINKRKNEVKLWHPNVTYLFACGGIWKRLSLFMQKTFGFKELRLRFSRLSVYYIVYLGLEGDDYRGWNLTYNYDPGPYVIRTVCFHGTARQTWKVCAEHKAKGYSDRPKGLPTNPLITIL